MPLPPWTVELIRRGITDAARKASDPETLEKLKTQATEILQDLPETAARSIDAVMRRAEAGKESVVRWSQKQTALAVPMVNASGTLMHSQGTGVPLADIAMQSGFALMRGDCLAGDGTQERLQQKLGRCLADSGDVSALIASSFPAAMTAFSQLVDERPLVIHRNHAVRLPCGTPLPDAFGTLLPVIQEVGSVGDVSINDYDGLDSFCTIMADVGDKPLSLPDFGDRDALKAVVLPVGTAAPLADDSIPSAEAMLAGGADFVLLPGNGICGGPPCGIIIGPKASLDVIAKSAAWPALAASNAVQAMMVATLESASEGSDLVPMLSLLDTSEENLQGRVSRMQQRLSAIESIASVEVTSDSAKLSETGRWRIASRQLRIRHSNHSSQAWAEKLAGEVPAIVVDIQGANIVVDLRWVDAANDNAVATAIEKT